MTVTVTCPCGVEFEATRSTAKYCCPKHKGRYGQRKTRKIRIPSDLRMQILRLDGFTCAYCGAAPTDTSRGLHIDHMVSLKDGGAPTRQDNLAAACAACNLGKGERSLEPHEIQAVLDKRTARRASGGDA